MLAQLTVNNYTLVDKADLELNTGMTAITGETGTGKSLLLDALSLAIGARADADKIRLGQDRADIHARFDIQSLPLARHWLQQRDFLVEDDAEAEELVSECLLRRVVTREGRSRGYINGQPATLQQLREIGEHLVDIHAQHEHQSLLRKECQRRLLDDFAGHQALVDQVYQSFQQWRKDFERFTQLKNNSEETTARLQLLRYQVEELEQLSLQVGELESLETEQRNLANGESILHSSYQVAALCGGDDNSITEGLNRTLQILANMPEDISSIRETTSLLKSAQIQVEEAQREIEHHIDSFNIDPERLQFVEERLSAVYEIARKHRINAEELTELHANLQAELQSLDASDGDMDALAEKVEQERREFLELCQQLTAQRKAAGEKLASLVNKQLKKLAMGNAKIEWSVCPLAEPGLHGAEEVQIAISTVPGQALKPLSKIASGGELSRISLAIQVVTAQTSTTPTLIFDEVDVGIGGATADVVGQLLRKLGNKAQVLCVTHLAQVASRAHHHLRATKSIRGSKVNSGIEVLDQESKIEEIARMISSDKVTETSLEHAREMLGA